MVSPALAATDMAEREVAVPAKAIRVVSLVPSITETAFALGRGERLVGRTSFCEYPEQARKLPVVGDIANPSVEALLVLEPDLILTVDFGVNRGPMEAFESLKLPVYYLDYRSYESTLESIRRMGELLDARAEAAAMVAGIREAEQDVRRRTQGLPRPRVLVAVMHGPVWSAGPGTYLDSLLEAAGATNATSEFGFKALDTEAVLLAAPDIVLVGDAEAQRGSALRYWSSAELAGLPARKNGRVVALDPRDVVPGPHMRKSFYNVLRAVHPEAAP